MDRMYLAVQRQLLDFTPEVFSHLQEPKAMT